MINQEVSTYPTSIFFFPHKDSFTMDTQYGQDLNWKLRKKRVREKAEDRGVGKRQSKGGRRREQDIQGLRKDGDYTNKALIHAAL